MPTLPNDLRPETGGVNMDLTVWLAALGASLFAGVIAAAQHRPLALVIAAVAILLLTFVVRPEDFR